MKLKNKIIIVILLSVLFTIMSECKAYAEENTTIIECVDSGTCGENATWELLNDGTLKISGKGDMEFKNIIPWSQYKESIKNIIIYDGVTSIGYYAFNNCKNLINVILPESIISIDSNAFSECENLESINIPNNVVSIGEYAFAMCRKIKKIVFPSKINSLEINTVIYQCINLDTIVFKGNAFDISYFAFDLVGITKQTKIYYPASNLTWENKVNAKYNSDVNWIPYCTIIDDGIFIEEHNFSKNFIWAEDCKTCVLNLICNNCGFTFSQDCNSIIDEKKATCVEKGTITAKVSYSYQNVEYTDTKQIEYGTDGNNHIHIELTNYKDATYTSEGYTGDNYCKDCGKIISKGKSTPKLPKRSNKITLSATSFNMIQSLNNQNILFKIKVAGGKISYKSSSSSIIVSNGKITVKKNYCGIAIITVTAGNSEYKTVTKKITITVKPMQTILSSVKNTKIKTATVYWEKVSNISGYEVRYSLKSDLSNSKKIIIKGGSKVSTNISKLTKKKVYYIQVRAYKIINNKKIYGSWSSKRSIKIKK